MLFVLFLLILVLLLGGILYLLYLEVLYSVHDGVVVWMVLERIMVIDMVVFIMVMVIGRDVIEPLWDVEGIVLFLFGLVDGV